MKPWILLLVVLVGCQATITGKVVQPIQEITDNEISCSLSYQLKNLEQNGIPQTCYENNVIHVAIENYNRDVSGVVVSVRGDSVSNHTLSSKGSYVVRGDISYSGKVPVLIVYPVAMVDGKEKICKNKLVIELQKCLS